MVNELKHHKEKPFCLAEFKSEDYKRLHTILNQAGGDFGYKYKSHKYTYTCVIQQEWQMKLNSKKRILKPAPEGQSKDWEHIISHPNCHIHNQFHNVAVTYLHEKNVHNEPEEINPDESANSMLRLSYMDKEKKVYNIYVKQRSFNPEFFSPDQVFKPLLEYCNATGELRFDEPNRKDEFLSVKLPPILKDSFQKKWLLPVTTVHRSD